MLLAYFSTFFYAAFTHLVTHPLILVYPIISALAILYSRNNLVRIFYALICLSACAYTVYLQIAFFGADHFASGVLSAVLISIGLMLAFPSIFIVNSNLLEGYQKQLEENQMNLKLQNNKLNTYIDSNLQLENFAHLASHELKSPLRNIVNLTTLLQRKTKDKLDEEEAEMLNLVSTDVGRMDRLIADLLEFSLIKNTEIEFHEIQMNDLLNKIIQVNFSENQSQIESAMGIRSIHGHEGLLGQLFTNLIANALKFSSKSEEPKVRITGTEQRDSYEFKIADNGIGIQPEYKEHVFLIFKRLHRNTEYPGTGIGLAICKNIVERHGGRIWIEDNPNGGTIVNFTLRKSIGPS